MRQGIIISTDGFRENCMRLRINASNKNTTNAQDKAIADTYSNKSIIPLDFEMLDSAIVQRLCYELMFNNYNRVIKSAVSSLNIPDATNKIIDISLE